MLSFAMVPNTQLAVQYGNVGSRHDGATSVLSLGAAALGLKRKEVFVIGPRHCHFQEHGFPCSLDVHV